MCHQKEEPGKETNHTQLYLERRQIQETTECVKYTMENQDFSTVKHMRVVTKCHPDYTGDTADTVEQELCENGTYIERSLKKLAMVYHKANSLLFKNRFCARCNFFNDSDLQNVDPDFICSNDKYASELFRAVPFEQFVLYLLYNCDLQHNIRDIAVANPQRLKCPNTSPLSSSCYHDNLYNDICKTYSSFVIDTSLPTWALPYKNVHCAVCSGRNVSNIACPNTSVAIDLPIEQAFDDIASFTILMDFTKSSPVLYNKLPSCAESESLNILSNACVAKTCPPSMISVNGSCYSYNATRVKAANLYEDKLDFYVEMQAVLAIDEARVFDLHNALKTGITLESARGTQAHNDACSLIVTNFNCTEMPHATDLCRMSLKISIRCSDHSSSSMISALNEPTNQRFVKTQILSALPNVTQIMALNYDPTAALACQGDAKPLWPQDLLFLADGMITADYLNPDVIHWRINRTGDTFTASMAAVRVAWIHDFINDEEFQMQRTINPEYWSTESECGICDLYGLQTCPKLAFAPHQYTIQDLMDDQVQVTFEVDDIKKSLEMSKQSVLLIDDELLVVCVEWYINAKQEQTLREIVQTWLTLIGMVLSIAALCITIFTILLFPELQNVPGRVVLNPSVSLLIAQFLFLTHYIYVIQAIVCKLVASLEHYFWLVSFSWMNVFALNVSFTFIKMYRFSNVGSHANMLLYNIFAWGLPMVFVVVCNAVEHFGGKLIEYGARETNTCWISPPRALLYAFALPLGVIMLINTVCFSVTIFVFVNTHQSIRQVVEDQEVHKSRGMVLASIKLSLVMGFTWLSGFLANIPSLAGLWYLFIVLNSMQGVMIFSVFGCNRRILTFYQRLTRTGSRVPLPGHSSTLKLQLPVVTIRTPNSLGEEQQSDGTEKQSEVTETITNN